MSESIRVLHAADLHIGAEFSFLDENKKRLRKSEMRLAQEKIFNICRDNKIDFLLLAGDVFDSNAQDAAETDFFFSGVAKIPGTQVIAAGGNHDPLTVDSPYFGRALPENLHILTGGYIVFEDKNCAVYGDSFTGCYKEPQKPFFEVDPGRINIAVLHGDVQPGSRYNYISREFIANSGMDYVALGHIHTHSPVQKLGGTYYAYSGCPEPHGFDECGEMGVIAANIGKANSEFSFLPISRRRFETVTADVTGIDTNAGIAEHIGQTLQSFYGDNFGDNFYKILLSGETESGFKPDVSEIVSRLENKVFYIKATDNTHEKTDINLLSLEKSLKGEFVRVMLKKIEDEPAKKAELEEALKIGLKAFGGEVKYDENK